MTNGYHVGQHKPRIIFIILFTSDLIHIIGLQKQFLMKWHKVLQ